MYLHEIGKVSLLNAHDEKLLARQIELARFLKEDETRLPAERRSAVFRSRYRVCR